MGTLHVIFILEGRDGVQIVWLQNEHKLTGNFYAQQKFKILQELGAHLS